MKKDARVKITKRIIKAMKAIEPAGDNALRYKEMLEAMSSKQFDTFMNHLKNGTYQLHVIMPNMLKTAKVDQLLEAAKEFHVNIFHRLKLTDPATGRKYLTPNKYPVLNVAVRRMQQFLEKKLSVPDNDTKIDSLTGQVTGDDRASALSTPEIQALYTAGLKTTLNELVTARGGDVQAYGEIKRQMEEGGEARLSEIESNSRARSAVMTSIFMEAMHIDTSL